MSETAVYPTTKIPANLRFSVHPVVYADSVACDYEQEVKLDRDRDLREIVRYLLGHVEHEHGGRRIKRLELEQRSDHVAIYATFSRHLQDTNA